MSVFTFLIVLLSGTFGQSLKNLPLAQEYDFIVVGGGAAGAVVASRLSEIAKWTVLLLEAGGDEGIISQVPQLIASSMPARFIWNYIAEQTPWACQGRSDKRCPLHAGKGLGGSTLINYMAYTRGNRQDYDHWEAAGNPGWGYRHVLPYFLKSEDQKDSKYAQSPYHAVGGPLTVSEPNYHTPLSYAFLESVRGLGYPIRDTNGRYQYGFQFSQGMIRDGRRCSSNKAFLSPTVRKRPNLQISVHSRVIRLLLQNNRVIGVEVLRDKSLHHIQAKKEVILCAGTLNNPQILMLSGIGPQDHLQELNIPVVKNLSVGLNLQDQAGMGGLAFVVNNSITSLGEDELNDQEAVEQWLAGKGGPLSALGSFEAFGFVSTPLNKEGQAWPDVEMAFLGTQTTTLEGILLAQDNFPKGYDALFLPLKGQPMFVLVPYIMRPRSRGFVRLRSKDPNDLPIFNPNYLSDRHDVEVILEGTKIALQIPESPTFKKLGSRLNNTSLPGCEKLHFGSDAYWECQLRLLTISFYHLVGTCKMGPAMDPNAVVNHRLQVHGMSGLRIVDVSIAPTMPSCHTASVAIMIGEKGADMIKEDWSYQ